VGRWRERARAAVPLPPTNRALTLRIPRSSHSCRHPFTFLSFRPPHAPDVESAVDFIKDVSGDFELEAPPAAAASTEATAESSSSATKVAGGGAAATKMDVDGAADDGATESKVAEPTAEEVELKQRLQIANQKRLRIGEEGYIICMCEVACLRMRQEEQLKCKRLLQKATALVDTRDVDLLDPSVNSTLHGSHASYFKK
jgi:hypothetical protein